MSAYMVFTREKILDAAELAIYQREVGPTHDAFDFKMLVAFGRQEVLEGEPIEGVAIVEFQQWKLLKHGTKAQPTAKRESTVLKVPKLDACSFRALSNNTRNPSCCVLTRSSAPTNVN